ncbi:MAG: transcriptional regulator [Rhodovulum sulfidophilum]|uniref:Transcriptional regulator n=1 Tax=Rhodovulum sulfidophilum TaxID=35806 RepID=A0A2W5PLC6_RHOSU|nr:MAG: transcriptional regulator [Rhodovulum sulfidophilum]
MSTLTVRLGAMFDSKARFIEAVRLAQAGTAAEAVPTLNFASYDDMHRILAPSRLAIVKALGGQGALSIREVARRIGRDVKAVHRDVTTLVNAGVIDRSERGVEFPYDGIRFDFDLGVAA